MLNLLALAWLGLINLMLHLFPQISENKKKEYSGFAKIINIFRLFYHYVLSVVFIGLSIAIIILSFKMLRV